MFLNDENKTRIANYVHWIALVFMGAILGYIVFSKVASGVFVLNLFDAILFSFFLVIYGIWIYSKRGYVQQAGLALVSIL